MRKGIVLMMTLGFIAVITAMILWSLSITKSRFDKVAEIEAQNQFAVVFKDFSALIKKFDINSSEKLDMFLSVNFPAIMEEKTKIGLGFTPTSLMDKLNINYMLKTMVDSETNSTKAIQAQYYRRSLEKFFRSYELSDPYTMLGILQDCIDKDDVERASYSEIVSYDFDFRQGKIYDFNQFKKIKDYYYKSTRDPNIFNISKDDFEEYFYFGDTKEYGLLDCSSLDVDRAMGLIVEDEMSITDESDFCEESNSTSMRVLKKIYNISQYSNKSKYLVKCIVNLDTEGSRSEISFDYEVNSKRISNIEKSFQ
jgi:hypothetical protein